MVGVGDWSHPSCDIPAVLAGLRRHPQSIRKSWLSLGQLSSNTEQLDIEFSKTVGPFLFEI